MKTIPKTVQGITDPVGHGNLGDGTVVETKRVY
jgi:hypothetical protein